MLRRIFAAGVLIAGSTQTSIRTDANAHRTGACTDACLIASAGTLPGDDAFTEGLTEGVARIAARAAAPAADSAPLTEGEWLSLYLLLSLQPEVKDTAS